MKSGQQRFASQRRAMVEHHIAARGIKSQWVLEAMRTVPRESFLPLRLHKSAYDDVPLPIGENQTISQPYIVGLMIDALNLKGHEKVLEVGTGSGYAAAVLAEIVDEVYTIERIGQLADTAASRLANLGYQNVRVLHADGTRGWPEYAPYDAIIVAAGGPDIPETLKSQLSIGGRLVIPVGPRREAQELVRVTRLSEAEFKTEDIADVRFVPLLGAEGWNSPEVQQEREPHLKPTTLEQRLAKACEPFESIEHLNLDSLLQRIGESRIVLLGESTHGTSEFYRLRERISQALIEYRGFNFIAIEADWPDAARIDHYVRHLSYPASEWTAFARFPTWMWRNEEVRKFVEWLRKRNGMLTPQKRTAWYGLDLYSLYTSINEVLKYLEQVDPETAEVARQRYDCLSPWQSDPSRYGHATLTDIEVNCEHEVVTNLKELLAKQIDYQSSDGERLLDALQNARLIASAEQYYRIMYHGSRSSWNLRDRHMFETLQNLLNFYGPKSKAIVWAHNSHIGDSSATDMAARGEYNIGHLCREKYGDAVYSIGFGTHSGTVAAASRWDGDMQIKKIRPSLPNSYEELCHNCGISNFLLPLRTAKSELFDELSKSRLQRAIGVIYRPDSEFESHYFNATLTQQFDEYVWFDTTRALTPLKTDQLEGLPDTYPFGL